MNFNWIARKKVILLFAFWELAYWARAHNETVDLKDVKLSREILEFLKDGEKKMEVGKFKNVTLVLGFTGSGKSTLTQFITGNDDGLISQEIGVDTGEFIIIDKNNNVCNKTVESCTIIPTLYVEKETNSGFYDCPGFGDTRSVKHDISVTYFIKKVVDSADAVKLLFVVNYPSVRQGVDRQNFMLLVKNVINMVKNVERFKDSIALVVTKVDNQYIVKRGQAVLVPDRTIIANIANFLQAAKDSINAKVSVDPDGQTFYQKAIKFIDILLEKNGDDYSRIGLFRRPDEGGKLRDTALLQSGKARLDRILRQNIRFIPKAAEDFGYTLSADSLNHMHALIFNINEDLALNFRSMAAPIMEHYRSQEPESKNIEGLCQNFTYGHESLLKIKEAKNYSTPISLMKEFEALAKMENIELPSEIMANIAHYDHFLNFLNSISGLTSSSLQWLQGLNYVVEDMSRSRNWLNLLVNLQNELLKYDVIQEVRRNQTAADTLKDQIDSYEVGSEAGLSNSLHDFLQQVFKGAFEKEYEKIQSTRDVSVVEWKLLRDLLDFQVLSSCGPESPQHTLVGQYVKLSDIRATGCSNKRIINIFALRKVFIDEDFIKRGEMMKLAIMAPTWEVVGSPKIVLDGKDAPNYYPRKAGDGVQSCCIFRHGSGGRNGENGGAAGLFWGIGQNCVNCHHLTVSANGGKGGDGQDGGDGATGIDSYHEYKGDQDGLLITVVYNTKVWDKLRYGQEGGNGGRGGWGGSGGPEGMAKFVLFGDGTKPKTSAFPGRPGRGGAGGSPGRGGHSDRVIQRVRAILFIPWEKNEVINLGTASSGSWGINGLSPEGTYSEPERFQSPSETLASYTKLLQFQTMNGTADTTSHQFVMNLRKNKVDNLIKRRRRSTNEFRDNDL